MIKRSVLPSAITSTARNSGPGRYGGRGSAVRTLARYCNFQSELDIMLRDRFILGLQDWRRELGRRRVRVEDGNRWTRCATGERVERRRRRTVDVRGAPLALPVFGVSCVECESQCKECRFANYKCNKCEKKGHLRRMCRKKGDARASHYLAAELAGDVEGNKKCYNIKCVNGSPLFVVVTLNRLSIECEVDSGSAVSAMSNTFYTAYFKHQALSRINGSLRCYDGSPITPRGSCSLSVTYRGRTKQIKFYIIDNGCHVQPAPILGRDFMSEFNLGISEMKYIDNPVIEETSVAKILMNKFPAVFSNKLGKLNKFKVQLQLKPDAKPIFFKPRPVPFALKPKVDEALDKLIETGILKSVNYSDYATPITPVLKSDGTVRVCGDYSVTLNKVLHIDRYPLPRIEELFARLHEGKEFSKLDLSMAYMQLELTEDSQPLTCINTHRGLSNLHDWFWVIVGACDISKQWNEFWPA
ncbi:Uncharacterized protein K02A2.6 [Eumeta japonica]|uniref:Uncharacterized protein K02A2.6 n=1 Tax=Eumeta variegata TaxID=151549 RepID=A0A4C1YPQ8_EUMVA|nr:Uncharacterized protein K02A2.6 [Eumeta japonica]